MMLAFELLNKYKNDKDFIQKDIKAQKKKTENLVQLQEESNNQ